MNREQDSPPPPPEPLEPSSPQAPPSSPPQVVSSSPPLPPAHSPLPPSQQTSSPQPHHSSQVPTTVTSPESPPPRTPSSQEPSLLPPVSPRSRLLAPPCGPNIHDNWDLLEQLLFGKAPPSPLPAEASAPPTCPVTAVFCDPVILLHILTKVDDLVDAKNCRLVCKQWTRIGAAPVGRKGYLTLRFDRDGLILDREMRLEGVSQDMFRNIRIILTDKVPPPREHRRVIRMFEQHHHLMEYFQHDSEPSSMALFIRIMETFEFPALKEVVIGEDSGGGSYPQNYTLGNLPLRPSVRRLRLGPSNPNAFFRGDVTRMLSTILAWILDTFPNLDELTIEDNSFPDLEDFHGLKKLKLVVIPYVVGLRLESPVVPGENVALTNEQFQIVKVNRMIDQVSDSLVHLDLGALMTEGNSDDPLGLLRRPLPFSLQTMPQLKTLSIRTMELFRLDNYFTPTMFPVLQNVSFGVTPSHATVMHQFLRNIQDLVFETVSSLELSGFSSFDADFDVLRKTFPNTKRFKLISEAIKLTDFLSTQSKTTPLSFIRNRCRATELFFTTSFELATSWNLEEIVLETKFRTSLSGLFRCIPRLALTEGLKRVSITMKSFSEDLEIIDSSNNIVDDLKAFLPEVKKAKVPISLDGIRVFYDINAGCNPISVSLERFASYVDIEKFPLYFGPSFFAPLDSNFSDDVAPVPVPQQCAPV